MSNVKWISPVAEIHVCPLADSHKMWDDGIFFRFLLHNSKKSSTFAAQFAKRDTIVILS